MSAETAYTETQAEVGVATPAGELHGEGQGTPSLVDVTGSMMVLTWTAFAFLSLVLYKVAWKPILKALDIREKTIRRALESAEKASAEAVETAARNSKSLQAALDEARRIVEEARRAAQDHARQIHDHAEQQARALVDEARREINASVESARLALQCETGKLAIELATKVTERNMDSDQNRALVRSLAGEIDHA